MQEHIQQLVNSVVYMLSILIPIFVVIFIIAIFIKLIKKVNPADRPKDVQEDVQNENQPKFLPNIQQKVQPQPQGEKFPYILVDSVFTHKESLFCSSLVPIANKLGLNMLVKMRIADLIYVPRNHPEYMRWFNYIRSKHIDFIICDGAKPVLLIEVDDSTHDRPSRQKRDDFVDKIFNQLNLPIIHIRTWSDEGLEQIITEALKQPAIPL